MGTLQAQCLRVLCEHLPELLDECAEVLPYLPSTAKACLLAACRRRDVGGTLLTDESLLLLADESWTVLDLHGAQYVTDTAVLQAVKRCTFLQAVDVGCCARLTSVALAAILRSCSRLQLLRVGGCACSDRAAHAALKTLRTRLNDVDPPAQWEDHWDNPEFQQPIAAPSLRAMHWPGVDERAQQRLRTTCPRIRLTGQHEPGAAAAAATASSEDMVIYLPRNSILSAPSLAAAAAAGGAVRLRRRENIDEDDFWGSEASSESDVDGERDGAAAAVRGVREAGRVRQFARGERERGGAVMRHADAHGDDRSRADDASTGLRPERCRQSGRLSGRLLDPHVKLDEVVLRALGLRLEDGGGKRADGDAERQAADGELHIAERFRLAFDSRRERLAPKRAKNARQRMRRHLKGSSERHIAEYVQDFDFGVTS